MRVKCKNRPQNNAVTTDFQLDQFSASPINFSRAFPFEGRAVKNVKFCFHLTPFYTYSQEIRPIKP